MILALHGFLGLPSDWRAFESELALSAVELWPDANLSLDAWAEKFIKQVRSEFASGEKPILLGYSMGGRLAMHAAVLAPELFRAAIFISAHPGFMAGLAFEAARRERSTSDQRWADRWQRDEWSRVLADWNAQPVLHGQAIERLESDFDRSSLASAMSLWSLACQRDLREELRSLALPKIFIAGERDGKFKELLAEFHPVVIEEAGHRVPWDNPARFVSVVREFLSQIEN